MLNIGMVTFLPFVYFFRAEFDGAGGTSSVTSGITGFLP